MLMVSGGKERDGVQWGQSFGLGGQVQTGMLQMTPKCDSLNTAQLCTADG